MLTVRERFRVRSRRTSRAGRTAKQCIQGMQLDLEEQLDEAIENCRSMINRGFSSNWDSERKNAPIYDDNNRHIGNDRMVHLTRDQNVGSIELVENESVDQMENQEYGQGTMANYMYKETPELLQLNYYQELEEHLPVLMESVGIMNKDDVFLSTPFDMVVPPLKNRDKITQTLGLGSIPYIRHKGNRNKEIYSFAPGQGITVYETELERDDKSKIKYAVIFYGAVSGNPRIYFISRKRDVYPLYRHFKAKSKIIEKEYPAPILEQRIIDTVVDNTIRFLRHKRTIGGYGVKVRRGILLSGPPGNGKTSLCRWLGQEAQKDGLGMQIIDGSRLERSFGEGQMQNMFRGTGGIVFLDDIEISHLHRQGGKSTVASSLLSALDGVIVNEDVVFVLTTNEDVRNGIEPAFLRPGRIDVVLEIPKPTAELRKQFIETLWHSEILEHLAEDDNMDYLMRECEELSFAEMDNIKSILVSQHVFNGGWNVKQAIEIMKAGRGEVEYIAPNKKKGKAGF